MAVPTHAQRQLTVQNDIVVFSAGPADGAAAEMAGHAALRFSDYPRFRAAGGTPLAFIIQSDDEHYTSGLLRQLRGEPAYAARPIYVNGAVAAADRPLSDGPLPATEREFRARLEQVRERAAALPDHGGERSADALLLEFLWLRPGYALEPLADWRHERRYRYPLLEALDRSGADPDSWLQRLDQRGLLERAELRDRQRECAHCGSAHLSFIDVCPNCRSLAIDQHSALHCFTCGFVAPEERFIHGDRRVCPKCKQRLRHIGSDYDRPLETNACDNCDHVFIEGEVLARCTVCGHAGPPTELRLRKLYSWQLSGAGQLAAQSGRYAPQPAFDALHYASYPHFVGSLDWTLRIARSSECFGFCVIGLHLWNLAQLGERLGTVRCAELVDACAVRLREQLADGDLATRADPETFYLLLPNADRRRVKQLAGAIGQLLDHAHQDEGAGPRGRIAYVRVAPADTGSESAAQLLAQLRSSLHAREAQAA